MHKVGRFLFPTTSWGNEVGSQVAVYPTLAREAFCGDAPQAFLVFRSSGLFGSSEVFAYSTACFLCMLRFLGFLPLLRRKLC